MPSTGEQREAAVQPMLHPRRRVLAGLAGLAGLPLALVLPGCSSREPPAGHPASGAGVTSSPSNARPTEEPAADAPALEVAASEAIALLATYESTVALHPTLAAVLAPYATDHDAHLEALGELITLPTPPPTGLPSATTPAASPSTSGSVVEPRSTSPPVPADPAAALAAVVRAEEASGVSARGAARRARDGEAARLLASIGASRAVHALLLGAPA